MYASDKNLIHYRFLYSRRAIFGLSRCKLDGPE